MTAITKRMRMNPPGAYEETTPDNQRTMWMIAIVSICTAF